MGGDMRLNIFILNGWHGKGLGNIVIKMSNITNIFLIWSICLLDLHYFLFHTQII